MDRSCVLLGKSRWKGRFLKVVREGLGGLEIGIVLGVLVLGGAHLCCWMQCCLKSPFPAQWVQGAQSPLVSELGRQSPWSGYWKRNSLCTFSRGSSTSRSGHLPATASFLGRGRADMFGIDGVRGQPLAAECRVSPLPWFLSSQCLCSQVPHILSLLALSHPSPSPPPRLNPTKHLPSRPSCLVTMTSLVCGLWGHF